jgi:hypothetical protein
VRWIGTVESIEAPKALIKAECSIECARAPRGIFVETAPVTQAELDDFNQVKCFVIVYGIVSYSDFFGTWHWTKICGFFPKPNAGGGVTAKPCADYADIDSN